MFWKKKNKQEKKLKAPEEARQAYRVAPDPENLLFLNLEGNRWKSWKSVPVGWHLKIRGSKRVPRI